jgi:hypothetical protein
MKRAFLTFVALGLAVVISFSALLMIPMGFRLVFAADPGLTPQTLEVVNYEATGYLFKVYSLGAVPSDYGSETFDDSGFATGDAAFGSGGGCPLQSTVKTDWPVSSEIVLRRSFDLPPGAANLRVMVAIDNDVEVFLNGVDISGGLVQHENCPVPDEFRFDAPDSILKEDNNVLAVRGRDRGVESCLDMRVLVEVPGTPSPTATPTPTRPPGVGGTVRLPPAAIAAESATAPESSDWSNGAYAALVGLGAVVAIAAGGWSARRRWLR